MTKVLKAENLVKKYGDFYAVNDIELKLNKGEVVGLLGPNGAGKTTSFYMIVGLIKPDSGNVFLHQNNITKVECLEYPELGMEAIWKIEVKEFPAFIVIDDKGNDFFDSFDIS